jgi:large subunit ribosomal protein L13
MIIINATNLIAGRIATFAAKQPLLGQEISIVNAENAVMTGNRDWILARFKQKRDHGAPLIGPYYPKQSDRILKRMIRGMLPYKQKKGDIALKMIKCYIGTPNEFANKDTQDIKGASIDKLPTVKYMKLSEISKLIGAKQ